LREPPSRSQHRQDGESRSGVVPAAGYLRRSRHRRDLARSAGARRHWSWRAPRDLDGRRDRQRGGERDRGADQDTPHHTGDGAGGAPAGAWGRPTVKPFAYVDAADEREAIAALGPRRGRFLPFAGGTDLLALMKNYVATPERLVNVKNLDSRVVRASDGGLKIGAAMTIDDLVNHPAVRQLYP